MFKVGDKVRITTGHHKDETGVVSVVGALCFDYRVKLDNHNYWIPEGPLFDHEELKLVAGEKPPTGYVWRDYAGKLHLQAYLSSVPDDATCVWELGEELVKHVTWEKKDA